GIGAHVVGVGGVREVRRCSAEDTVGGVQRHGEDQAAGGSLGIAAGERDGLGGVLRGGHVLRVGNGLGIAGADVDRDGAGIGHQGYRAGWSGRAAVIGIAAVGDGVREGVGAKESWGGGVSKVGGGS